MILFVNRKKGSIRRSVDRARDDGSKGRRLLRTDRRFSGIRHSGLTGSAVPVGRRREDDLAGDYPGVALTAERTRRSVLVCGNREGGLPSVGLFRDLWRSLFMLDFHSNIQLGKGARNELCTALI